MGVVQFHAIKAGDLCTTGSISKEDGQGFWKPADLRNLRIGCVPPKTKSQRLEPPCTEAGFESFQCEFLQSFTNSVFGPVISL